MVLELWWRGWLGGRVSPLDPDQGLVSSVLIVVLMVKRCAATVPGSPVLRQTTGEGARALQLRLDPRGQQPEVIPPAKSSTAEDKAVEKASGPPGCVLTCVNSSLKFFLLQSQSTAEDNDG